MEPKGGQNLMEVLIGVAILGMVAVAFLSALATAANGVVIADERTTAESLTRSGLEYVKNSAYDATNNPPQYCLDPDMDIPDGYDVVIGADRLDPEEDGYGDDDGIQEIVVEAYHQGKLIQSTADYKVDR